MPTSSSLLRSARSERSGVLLLAFATVVASCGRPKRPGEGVEPASSTPSAHSSPSTGSTSSALGAEFLAAIRAELPESRVELVGDEVVIALDGTEVRLEVKNLEAQCPAGDGPACAAAVRRMARATVRDIQTSPSCEGKPLEPALLMKEKTDASHPSAPIAGRLFVGIASYSDDRALRVWCTAAESKEVSSTGITSWAIDHAKRLPPPPVEPLEGFEGIWTVIDRRETAPYLLDPGRLSKVLKKPGKLVAIVPRQQILMFTTADRPDLVDELRKVAEARADGPQALSNEVYEQTSGGWRVLPK